jgi:Na+-translocating ferredoxin:NAD+ oxidoreductase RnfC subunit
MPPPVDKSEFVPFVKEMGVVGAGGAGFPTYVKLSAEADTVIANGAECEPLLHKDLHLLEQNPQEIVQGLSILRELVGANSAYLGIKAKNLVAIANTRSVAGKSGISIHELDDVYPVGDEVDLVYELTDRRVPPGGIPIDVGVVVNNVETLFNLGRASQGYPVTRKLISVAGIVPKPQTFWVPIGTSYRQAIEFCGGLSEPDTAVVDGGPMMGEVVFELDTPITKTSGGLVVLPRSHSLILRKTESERQYKRVGKSACDQCSDCTELCPRYLLGYPVQPHLVMRGLEFTGPESAALSRWAQLCSTCNLCSLYACPENLNPRDMCVSAKRDLTEQDVQWNQDELRELIMPVHGLHKYRQVPTDMLTRRLGLTPWDKPAPYTAGSPLVDSVVIPLKQHTGIAARAVVAPGDQVMEGDVIGVIDDGELGAYVHASKEGEVTQVNSRVTIRGKL